MQILLNKDNWKFIIDSLINDGYVNDDNNPTSWEDLEKVFNVEPDFKTLCFVYTTVAASGRKFWYCFTRFIHNEEFYMGSDMAGKSHQEYVKFILTS